MQNFCSPDSFRALLVASFPTQAWGGRSTRCPRPQYALLCRSEGPNSQQLRITAIIFPPILSPSQRMPGVSAGLDDSHTVCENSCLHRGPQLPGCPGRWDRGTSSTAAGLPGAGGVVGRSESLWEEGQWLPTLMAGLSQRKRKLVSTLRILYFILHCNSMKYQISALYSLFWWLYRSRTFRSISGSTTCGGTCSWKVPGLWLS